MLGVSEFEHICRRTVCGAAKASEIRYGCDDLRVNICGLRGYGLRLQRYSVAWVDFQEIQATRPRV